ncbi:hypothetical protein B0I35DRAFT_446247 [Stachybotrys elegans]|uniref:Uncharacterized protein n=1 Tax=Stachybotrys elegans TaxID=80388 RepID=A0A8K0SDY9_9HYPO|nr:hypothetical protein B0I35DRAFT_446247 [Stachybotrys elegans]
MSPVITTRSDPAGCQGDDCTSYLVTGGLESLTPWLPETHSTYSQVRVNDMPSVQMDVEISRNDTFLQDECDVFGAENLTIGMKLCIAMAPGSSGSLRVGLFICSVGIGEHDCLPVDPFFPNMTVHSSFFTRQVTIVASRSNYSIVSVGDKTDPAPYNWEARDIDAYRTAFRWLLNYTAAGIPAPSSTIEIFYTARNQLSSRSTSGILTQNVHGLLVFPFWLFNVNNWGNTEAYNLRMQASPRFGFGGASLIGLSWVVLSVGIDFLCIGLGKGETWSVERPE